MLRLAGTNGAHDRQVAVKRVPKAPKGRAEPRGNDDPARLTALSVAFAVGCALAPFPAMGQGTVYIGGGNPSVTVDVGVLDELGPTPTVPDLLLPTMPQPVESLPLRFPSQPPTFPTTTSSERPVVLVPPPQTNKPTLPAPAPQITAPAAPIAPQPAPEVVTTMPVPIEPPPEAVVVEEVVVEEEMVTVEETVEVAPPAAPPAPPLPEPEITAPAIPAAPSATPAAPTLPVVTETPVPAPPTPQTAAVDPSAGTGGQEEAARLLFDSDGMELSDAAKGVIREVAEQLNADETKRLQLMAYAAAADTSKARRLSLSRALAVRSELIALGVRSTRIDVRALGSNTDGGPADRVDLILADR